MVPPQRGPPHGVSKSYKLSPFTKSVQLDDVFRTTKKNRSTVFSEPVPEPEPLGSMFKELMIRELDVHEEKIENFKVHEVRMSVD